MKIYTGLWIAYKQLPLTMETKYANLFFSKTSDDEARGYLIGKALAECPKSDGWGNHSCSFTEVPLSAITMSLELMQEDD